MGRILYPKELLAEIVKHTTIDTITVEGPEKDLVINLVRLNQNCKQLTTLNAQSEDFTKEDAEYVAGLKSSTNKTDRWTAWLVEEWHEGEPFELLYRALTGELIQYIKDKNEGELLVP